MENVDQIPPSDRLPKQGRRGFAAFLLKVSASVFAVGQTQAFSFFGSKKLPYLNEDWIARTKGKVVDYAKVLSKKRFSVISLHEVIKTHFKKRRVSNSLPPKHKWKNIIPTLQVVDQVAKELGVDQVKFISVYRSPRYNRSIGGAKRSCHMENIAVDVNFGCSSWKAMKVICKLRKKGKFVGGLGVYRNFIHIDTRAENVDWGLYKRHRS